MNLLKLGLAFVFVGMILAVIAVLLQVLGDVSAPGEGHIIVCVIPVCFGIGKHALPMIMVVLALTIALIIVSLVFMTYVYRKIKETILHNVAT